MAVNLMVLRSFLDNGYIFHILFSSMGKASLSNTKYQIRNLWWRDILYAVVLVWSCSKKSLSIYYSESGHFSPSMTPSTYHILYANNASSETIWTPTIVFKALKSCWFLFRPNLYVTGVKCWNIFLCKMQTQRLSCYLG